MAMKTIPIKTKDGEKEYVPVNERIKYFWEEYPDGRIITDLLHDENGRCIFKAEIYAGGELKTTGYAYEQEGSSFINKTSYIENCETSAVGRALGNFGIGVDTSVASYEEVVNAAEQLENGGPIEPDTAEFINAEIEALGIDYEKFVAYYNVRKVEEIKAYDWPRVAKDLEKKRYKYEKEQKQATKIDVAEVEKLLMGDTRLP